MTIAKKLTNTFVFLSLCLVTAYAMDWKEKVAAQNTEKVVKLDIYGQAPLVFFGKNLGMMPFHGLCSGVYMDETGGVLTAKHCVGGEGTVISSITVTTVDGWESPYHVKAKGNLVDLAYLNPDILYEGHTYPFAELTSVLQLHAGQDILAIGHPLWLYWTVTSGIVSYTSRQLFDGYYVQFDAVIAPGSSGGPVFDKNGSLVGIVSMYRGGPAQSLTGLNFMVPPSDIKLFLSVVNGSTANEFRTRKYKLGDIQ